MSGHRTHRLHLRTPEGVTFSFRLASPVLRLVALVVDVALLSAVNVIVTVCMLLFGLLGGDLALGLGLVLQFGLGQAYRIIAEWRWRGQTLGKKLVRLRVIDCHGLPLTFGQVLLRNLLRFVDTLPVFYAVGGIATLLNSRAQRLGDLAAGTVVIWEPTEISPDLSAIRSDKYNTLRAHPAVVARLRQAVSPAAARAAWQALARRDQLEPAARAELFAAMADHFRGLTPWPAETTDGVGDEQLVRNVVDVLLVSRV